MADSRNPKSVDQVGVPVAILVSLLLLAGMAFPTVAKGEPIVFFDRDFVDHVWESSIVEDTGPGPTTFTSESDSVPARAGGVRRITHTWSGPTSATDTSQRN